MKDKYHEALQRLYYDSKAGRRKFSKKELAAALPHVKDIEGLIKLSHDFMLRKESTKLGMAVAAPPLNVEGVLHRVRMHKGEASYSSVERAELASEFYAEEAFRYAQDNWGEDLVKDEWQEILAIVIEKPRQGIDSVVYAGISKPLSQIDTVEPYLLIISDHQMVINEMTVYRSPQVIAAVKKELKKQLIKEKQISEGEKLDSRRFPSEMFVYRPVIEVFNCGYDGEPLGKTKCLGCGLKITGRSGSGNWRQPLPKSVVEYMIENGYKWQIAPRNLNHNG